MKKFFKYTTISIICLLFLLTITMILLPAFINEQRYVTVIEKEVSDVTGRSFSIGSDLNISYFPWLSISFSNLKLGNPEGFSADDFLSIESFEAQVELLSLLLGQIHVRRFVVGGLEINMERRADGSENWLLGKNRNQHVPLQAQSASSREMWPENMNIALFAVTDAKINFKDQVRQTEHRIDDMMVLATDVSPDKPVATEIKALVDGKPVSMEGNVGPFISRPESESVSVDLRMVLANVLKTSIRGKFSNVYTSPSYDLNVQVESFSPRYLCDILGIEFPLTATSPETYNSLSLNMIVKGTQSEIHVEQGDARLDSTGIDFSFTAKNFYKPVVTFDVDLDSIDLMHYFTDDTREVAGNSAERTGNTSKTYDYSAWNNIYITGKLSLKTLTFNGGKLHDIRAQLNGSDGVFTIDPSSFFLNNGQVQSTVEINVQKKVPRVSVSVQPKNLLIGDLLHDAGNKSIVSGILNGEMKVDFNGFDFDSIKKTLEGQGTFVLQNGVLHGIDLQGEVTDKSSIEYSQLSSVFKIKDGIFTTRDTRLLSPSGEMQVSGRADLLKDEIDFMMKPSFANVEEGADTSGDDLQRLMVVTVKGTFSSPVIVVGNQNVSDGVARPAGRTNVQKLVDEKIPSPVEDDVKGLVGKALIDPEIVARRFGLQPVEIRSLKQKKVFPVGNGKIEIGQLLEKDVFQGLQGDMQ